MLSNKLPTLFSVRLAKSKLVALSDCVVAFSVFVLPFRPLTVSDVIIIDHPHLVKLQGKVTFFLFQ